MARGSLTRTRSARAGVGSADKLKSVAHMPWRVMTYKAFNTFVDDAFAILVSMPIHHKIACLRDDAVFVVFLIQRFLYPVDKRRANEYGIACVTRASEPAACHRTVPLLRAPNATRVRCIPDMSARRRSARRSRCSPASTSATRLRRGLSHLLWQSSRRARTTSKAALLALQTSRAPSHGS